MNIIIQAGPVVRTQAGATHALVEFANRLARIPSVAVYLAASEYERSWLHPAIQVVQYRTPPRRKVLWRFKHLGAVAHMAGEMRRHALPRMDLCFSHGVIGPLAFRQVCPSVPVVSHTGAVLMKRERQEELHRGYRWYAALDAMLVDKLERETYRQPKWAHIVSTNLVARERQKYFNLPAGFFNVCPYGLNLDRFSRSVRHPDMRAAHGVPASALALVTVARLVPLKNIQMVLRALARCRRKDVYLFVVGEGEEGQPLRRLAAELGVAERVRFVGHIDEPAPFYAASDIFILPSFVESFGIVYAEAMLMGLPCIGLRSDPPRVLSAAEDVIVNGRTGYCVSDQDELVQRIDQLGDDERLRAEMGRRGSDWARNRYSSEHYVDFILTLARQRFGVDVPSVQLTA